MTLASNCLHHQQKKQKQQQQKEQHKAILAIDDETDIINVIKKSSQIIGFSIDGFRDPLLALEQYRANNNEYFLIIADLAMPSINGFEFIRKIRSTSADIKVVLMTASNISDFVVLGIPSFFDKSAEEDLPSGLRRTFNGSLSFLDKNSWLL